MSFDFCVVEGHRGAMGTLPENTISSIKYAVENFVDIIEVDILPTKESIPVLYHDRFISGKVCLDKDRNRLKEQIPITSLSLEELKEFDCGSPMREGFSAVKKILGEKIPSLEELFTFLEKSPLAHAKNVLIDLEIKDLPKGKNYNSIYGKFIDLILDTIEKYNIKDRVILQSLQYNYLKEIRKRDAKVNICLATMRSFSKKDIKFCSTMKSKYASIYHLTLTEDTVKELHDLGIKVLAWTANKKEEWERLLNFDVDIINTDYPVELMNFIKKNIQSK